MGYRPWHLPQALAPLVTVTDGVASNPQAALGIAIECTGCECDAAGHATFCSDRPAVPAAAERRVTIVCGDFLSKTRRHRRC